MGLLSTRAAPQGAANFAEKIRTQLRCRRFLSTCRVSHSTHVSLGVCLVTRHLRRPTSLTFLVSDGYSTRRKTRRSDSRLSWHSMRICSKSALLDAHVYPSNLNILHFQRRKQRSSRGAQLCVCVFLSAPSLKQ